MDWDKVEKEVKEEEKDEKLEGDAVSTCFSLLYTYLLTLIKHFISLYCQNLWLILPLFLFFSSRQAVMKFFRQLYGDADEDTRRAMMKSYEESGGKSLSTNWQDVGSRSFKKDAEE